MRFGEGQRKWMELKKSKDGVGWCHRDMQNEMYVVAVVQVRVEG
jgi:hypothetical protein